MSDVTRLGAGEVQVVHAGVRAARDVDGLRAELDAEELARADRLRFAKDRRRFVVAHGMLRRLLGAHLGVPASGVRFRTGPHGKPSIAEPASGASLRFSLSHSGDVVAVALARGRDVGVDVEHVRPDLRSDDLARRFFSVREQAVLRALPDDARRATFFRIWTAKEAFVKATGEGLVRGLAGFDVVDEAGALRLRVDADPDEAARWSLHALAVAPGYAAAVAVEGAPAGVVVVPWVP